MYQLISGMRIFVSITSFDFNFSNCNMCQDWSAAALRCACFKIKWCSNSTFVTPLLPPCSNQPAAGYSDLRSWIPHTSWCTGQGEMVSRLGIWSGHFGCHVKSCSLGFSTGWPAEVQVNRLFPVLLSELSVWMKFHLYECPLAIEQKLLP